MYTYNNMDWLQLDAQNGAIDFIVHLGDHAYVIGWSRDWLPMALTVSCVATIFQKVNIENWLALLHPWHACSATMFSCVPTDSGRRGDGYFSAFQPVLASLPWVPILG